MKKLFAAAAPLALVAAMLASDNASADQPILVPSSGVLRYFATRVTGTISVPGAQSGALSGLGCTNILVTAQSTKMNGFFPAWTRTANASGTYSSGKCSYTVYVPAGNAFQLEANGHGNFACDVIAGMVDPATLGPYTVASGQSKTVDFKIKSFNCENIQ